MPVRSDSPSGSRSAQSELDPRAINVVGHLLTTAIWLEHQLRNTPTPRRGLVGISRVRSPLRRLRSVDLQPISPLRQQPSLTANLALDLTMIDPQVTSHERFEADLAELAAGVFDRRREAALLNHLASCPRCTANFDQLVTAAKSLLLAALEIELPVGFESRFWDRIESCSSELAVAETAASYVSHR